MKNSILFYSLVFTKYTVVFLFEMKEYLTGRSSILSEVICFTAYGLTWVILNFLKKVNYFKTRAEFGDIRIIFWLFKKYSKRKKLSENRTRTLWRRANQLKSLKRGRLRERLTMGKRIPYEMEIHFFGFFIFFLKRSITKYYALNRSLQHRRASSLKFQGL